MSGGLPLNLIEQAARRLEEMQRAGVQVPWTAAGFSADDVRQLENTPAARPAAEIVRPFAPPRVEPPPPRTEPSAPPAEPAVARIEPVLPAAQERMAEQAPARPGPARQSRAVTIDLAALARDGYLVPGGGRSVLADELRVIKRPLLKNAALGGAAALRRGNLLQVTSAVPGEGKTFTAINLAISLSMEVDHSVLLVDADVVRPTVLSRLGLPPSPGLMDVLQDPSIDLGDVMLRTNVPKLTLLPSGAGAVNSTELLASASMEALLDELASKYADRIIIFDAPPLLAATESRVLASRVGQVVVVVEAGVTSRKLIGEAFDTVANCPVVLPVLNKYAGPPVASPYGY